MRKTSADTDGIVSDAAYAERIKQHPAGRWKVFQPLAKRIRGLAGPGAVGLDLGAGEGFLAKCLQENGLKVIALEGSPHAVAWGRDALGIDSRTHNLKTPLPFSNDSFDFIVYHNVYEHVPPAINENVFREAFRVLKPGGIFLVDSTCKYDFVESCELEHINNPTPSSLYRFGKRLGFQATVLRGGFNISLFTPNFYDKALQTSPNKMRIRQWLKRYRRAVTLLLAPVWLPVWFLNSKLLHLDILDAVCAASRVLFRKPA